MEHSEFRATENFPGKSMVSIHGIAFAALFRFPDSAILYFQPDDDQLCLFSA
jgi:hypothetical protein